MLLLLEFTYEYKPEFKSRTINSMDVSLALPNQDA